ncbi:MAG: SusC/RagA family TonB-linked outer membrane protein [Saprospiraceae bacterium]
MKRLTLTISMVLFSVLIMLGQRTITGTVKDNVGDPLIGANVFVKGTTKGTTTDIDGSFALEIPAGNNSIIVSYVGYTDQEIRIGNESVVDVILAEGITLAETVVTALNITRDKKSLTYAAQTVDGDKLRMIPSTSVNNALGGKIAGVQVRAQSAMALDRDASIRIRGAGSLNDKTPLYVVDGTPVASASDISVDDIATMNVLKGPNATALYGQRGDAGVILITTKKSSKKGAIGIDINSGTFFDNVYILPKYQNSYSGGGVSDLIEFNWQPGMPDEWKTFEGKFYPDYSDDASWGPRMVGQEYIPWYAWYVGTPAFGQTAKLVGQPSNIRDFYGTGTTLNNNASLTKSGDGYNVRLSYTNQNAKGMLPYSKSNKSIVNSSASFDLGKYISAGYNINFSNQVVNGQFDDGYANQSAGSFNQWFHRDLDLNKIKEYQGMKSPEGILSSWNHNNAGNYLSSPLSFYGGNYWYNYYDWFENVAQTTTRNRLFGDVNLTIKPFKHFTVQGFLRRNQIEVINEGHTASILETSGTQTGVKNAYFYNQGFYEPSITNNNAFGGITNGVFSQPGKEDNYEALASYENRFGVFSVNAQAGGNIRKNSLSFVGGATVDGLSVPDLYTLSNSKTAATFFSSRGSKKVNSLYGSASIGFKDFFYLDFAGRNDWSSTLPKNANSYFYPSVGASFVFSELMSNTSFISFGKLRGSWARVGSDLDPYSLSLNYGVAANQWNGSFLMGTPDALVDPNIKPSLSTSYEMGIDLKFWQNRVGFQGTYYNERKIDEILNVPVSGASGFSSKNINAGRVDRDGVELTLEITPIQTKKAQWDILFNWAKNNSKIVELADGIDAIVRETGTFGTRAGATLVHQVGQRWGQVRGGGIKRNAAGVAVLDASGLFQAVPNSYFGSVLPDWNGGITNQFTYGNLFANFNIDFSKGGVFYSLSDNWGKFSGLFAATAELNDKGNPSRDAVSVGGGVHVTGVGEDGTAVDTYVEAFDYWHQFFNRNIAEASIKPLDYIKLREVNVGYRIPTKKLGLKYINDITVSVIARNPWLISSKTKDFDPSEIGQRYGENGQFPGTRSFGFNIKLGF